MLVCVYIKGAGFIHPIVRTVYAHTNQQEVLSDNRFNCCLDFQHIRHFIRFLLHRFYSCFLCAV